MSVCTTIESQQDGHNKGSVRIALPTGFVLMHQGQTVDSSDGFLPVLQVPPGLVQDDCAMGVVCVN